MDGPTTAQLMVGSEIARGIRAEAGARSRVLETSHGVRPCLATVLVGDDPASVTYVRMKRRSCRRASIDSRKIVLDSASTTEEVIDAITSVSLDPRVHGILLQHPVPRHVDERAAFEAIAPRKDVDGVTMHSFASMSFGLPGFASCTPAGIVRLLDAHGVDLSGRHAVVIGRSPILGKPVGMLLLARDATVTLCHSKTRDLPDLVATADLIIAAVGKPNFVRASWVKEGAVVVDAGYNPGNVGDVAFDEVVDRASMITPVPGGVGPMTIALLLEQTVEAAEQQLGRATGGVTPGHMP